MMYFSQIMEFLPIIGHNMVRVNSSYNVLIFLCSFIVVLIILQVKLFEFAFVSVYYGSTNMSQ